MCQGFTNTMSIVLIVLIGSSRKSQAFVILTLEIISIISFSVLTGGINIELRLGF